MLYLHITQLSFFISSYNFQFVELNIRMIRLRYGSIPIPQVLIGRPYRPV